MKKPLTLVTLSTLLLATAACGSDGDSGSADGETITLRLASGLSDTHAWWSDGANAWAERVTELTDGQVEFETFTGGELVEVPDEAESVLNGTIDVGLILPIYTPDQYPLAEVTMLPVTQSDAVIAAEAWQSILESDVELESGKTYYEEMFGSKGLKAWPLAPTQAYSISTTGVEIDSAASISGLSLRTPSRIHEMYSANVGINSITMPAVEMYDAMSRGAFDGSFYSIADWSAYGFQDLFKYTLTDINFGHFNGLIAMTDATWEDLPPEVQEAMEQAHDEIYLAGAEEWESRGAKMVEENEAAGGVFQSFSEIPKEAQDEILGGIDETWSDYFDQIESEGHPGRSAALLWRDALVEAGGEVPESISSLE